MSYVEKSAEKGRILTQSRLSVVKMVEGSMSDQSFRPIQTPAQLKFKPAKVGK